jgi:peptidyl-prolyl cis-trans isomerase C
MNLKYGRLLAALLAAAALPVFAQNAAVVNGKPIPSSRVDSIVKQYTAQGQPESPEMRQAIREELITREVLMQEAAKRSIGDKPEVKTQLEMARQNIVIQGLHEDYLKKNPVTEAEMRKEYERFKSETGDKEYLARHILVGSQEEAEAIISKLKSGAKFEELAKQSKDPGSAAQGGKLDWASPRSYVKPFADALTSLKQGEITQKPVQSEFGYHVIKLEDVRDTEFPPFEQVKPQLENMLQKQKLANLHQELLKKAKIK